QLGADVEAVEDGGEAVDRGGVGAFRVGRIGGFHGRIAALRPERAASLAAAATSGGVQAKGARALPRIPLVNPGDTTADGKAIQNMFRAVANSPAALKSMWGAFGALGGGALPARLGEQIAVAIANRNACEYCLAAHTVLGRKAGASAQEMSEAQAGRSDDPKT